MRPRILRLFVLAVVVGACGGGDDGGDGDFRARFGVVGGDVPVAMEALRERARALEIDAEVIPETDGVVIELPSGDPAAAREEVEQLTRPGELRFYDWETNLFASRIPRDEAMRQAREGLVAVRERDRDVWHVLHDRPALTGEDILEPEQAFDNSPGGTAEPVVVFDFTPRGREAFRELTRKVAQRGEGHFAVVLDEELLSLPAVDAPIDARNGTMIRGGLTIESAQKLAAILAAGALPVRLERR